jgi:hypothetical protein
VDVVAKPERWALHRAGGVVALAFLITPLIVAGGVVALAFLITPLIDCGLGPASGAQEIPPKGVAAGEPEPVSKGQKQLRNWVAAGIQSGFIKPKLLSIDEGGAEMIWDFRSPNLSFGYPLVTKHQIDVESIRLSPAPAGRRALWEPYLQRMERLIADQLQYGIAGDAWDQYHLNFLYSQIFDGIFNEAMAATAKAAGNKPVSADELRPRPAPLANPQVILTTAAGEGLIFIAPKTGYLIAQRTGEAIPFTNVSPGDIFHHIGSYTYKIRYPDGRETPLRFIDIRSSGTYRLQ